MNYYRNFRTTPSLPEPWHVMRGDDIARENATFTRWGLSLWCRDGMGAGIMLTMPQPYGRWTVRMRISGPTDRPTTKVCCLLWPKSGDGWPPEIDFNESGERTRSSQTLHHGEDNQMIHTSYPVDQTKWHTYGVQVVPGEIYYICDGDVRAGVMRAVPNQDWNLHVRTVPNGKTDVTRLDVWSVRLT